MANFKMFEVTGATKSEALAKASEYFTVTYDKNGKVNSISDASQKYKKWAEAQLNGITEASRKEFGVEYLEDKKAIPGKAYYVTLIAAVENTREKPYKNENVKAADGSRDFDKAFVLYDKNTGEKLATIGTVAGKVNKAVKNEDGEYVLDSEGNKVTEKVDGKIRPTKSAAFKKADELMIAGHKGDIEIREVRETPNDLVGVVRYTPSKSSKPGTYLVFGYCKD